jgi:NAD(P)-dependent dehydrogenase (short-subunit alcohol dehydrogenase family)
MKRVLLIGSTGTFGQRLATHLAQMPELHVFLTSRSKERAQEIENRLNSEGAVARVESIAMLVERDLVATLHTIKPWLVIDASGPFQFAGYDVPKTALEAGAHFIDLADAQDYLIAFGRSLDGLAKAKGLVALAGASTTPAITTAVVDHVTRGWARVDTVDVAIVPGGSNTVGPALAAAVLAQAGVPITIFRHGRFSEVHGWTGSTQMNVPRLGTFRVAAAETVDPLIMPERYKLSSRMTFSAGLVSQIEQRGFEALAWLRRVGICKKFDWLVPALVMGRKFTRLFCDDRGGMVVRARGLDQAQRWTEATWSLVAEKGHGPNVPILPIVAAVRMLLADGFAVGARMIQGEIPLALLECEFNRLAISTQIDFAHSETGVFQLVMGADSYAKLPQRIRDFHDTGGYPVWHGEADVDCGTSLVARVIGAIIGLPKAGRGLQGQVSVEREPDGSETWTRTFGGHSFSSKISCVSDGKLSETFGPTTFNLCLGVTERGATLPVSSGKFFGIPLPQFLLPTSMAYEFVDDEGRFRFDVRLDLPFFGLLVHYRGWLVPRDTG